MIKPEAIPQFTGDLGQLEKDYGSLKTDAGHIRGTGSDVHTQFQGLSAYYQAPEAEKLFASTKPVQDRADGFADDLEKVSTALSDYATEVRPLAAKLEQLKADATTFVNANKGDDDWEYDEDKIDEHNQLRDDVTATVAAFWAAERTCHNKITALFPGGIQMVAGDGSDRKDQYGFNADDLKNAKLPWGDPVEEKHHVWEVGHWVKSFVWDGLIVDGIWGTIKGLGTLVGFGGWDAMGQAWKGLAQLATGLAITSIPGASTLFWTLPDDKLPSWLRDSRTAMKETGKALVAWDEWGKNPGRAAGAVTFNVLTTVFTGGAGAGVSGAGKAGAVAKVLSVAGKAGKVIDPMTYIAKGAGAGLSKIGDIAKGLKGIENIEIPKLPDDAIVLPEGALKLPDGAVHLPEGAVIPDGAVKLPDGNFKLPDDVPVLPEGATKLPTAPGAPARYFDNEFNLLDENGNVLQKVDDARVEGSPDIRPDTGADTNTPHTETPSPVREPALVGAGAHSADTTAHVGANAGDHAIRIGDSLGNDLGDIGRTGDNLPGSNIGDNLPGGNAGNHLPGGGVGDHMPTGHAGDNLPTGHADDLGHGPSASHEPPHGGGHSDRPGGEHSPESGGHGEGPTGGGHEGPTGPAHESAQVPHSGDQSGVPGGAHPASPIDEITPERYSRGDDTSHAPTEPMRPEQEAGLTDALSRAKMDPQDQLRVLRTLRKEPFGSEVADLISRGHLNGVKNYEEILSMCKQGATKGSKSMVPAAYMALSHATELQSRGFGHLAFELTDDVTGLDLDVTTLHPDGTPHYGYQLKDVDNIDGIKSAAKKAAKQLLPDAAAKKIAILDVHQSLTDLNAKMFKEVEFQARRAGATFQLRFHDGSITVPPNRPVLP
ncbi:hypothetical protein ACIA8E_18410 [Streptomyces sp. NPDC051664]|uniref:hypothetical protein n=1 Tax=Streptomyces sp. NPDC051664 TaxID=3365668 RepID=UPI00379E958E